MKNAILFALIAGGIMLLIWGGGAYKSADSDVTFLFTGSATDASMGMVVGGAVAAMVGVGGLLRGSRARGNS